MYLGMSLLLLGIAALLGSATPIVVVPVFTVLLDRIFIVQEEQMLEATFTLLVYLAIGWAENRQQVLEVGLVNYLWPALTLVLSLVLLGTKASWVLLPGTLLALAGVFVVVTHGAPVSWQSLFRNLASTPGAYSLALAAAVSWAMYSNLARKGAGGEQEGAVVLFLPIRLY